MAAKRKPRLAAGLPYRLAVLAALTTLLVALVRIVLLLLARLLLPATLLVLAGRIALLVLAALVRVILVLRILVRHCFYLHERPPTPDQRPNRANVPFAGRVPASADNFMELAGGTASGRPRYRADIAVKLGRQTMARYGLLWMLGVPIPILLLIWMFGGLN